MYSQPQDDALGQLDPAEAPGQLEPAATAAGAGAQDVHGPAASAVRHQAHVSSLLAEIARAMQAAAAQERDRIHAGVAEDETLQIEKVRTRATAELAALRKGADDDVRQVESWCEEQIRQIHAEAARRVDDRRRELEQSVTQHGTLIETEVESVHGAVQGYRDSLDAFFARMAEEGDPSAIAALAGTLPDPPDLDAVRADARSRAMKALEEEEASDQADPPSGEGPTDADAEADVEAAVDADGVPAERGGAGTRDGPESVTDPEPVMDPDAVSSNERVEPLPVMDLAAAASSNDSVAFRVTIR